MARVVFAGSPEFVVPYLEWLQQSAQHELVAVYTQPERPQGRGRKLQASAVVEFAQAAALPLYQPPSLRTPAAVSELAGLEPDILLVVAYGLIIPPEVLAVPKIACLNVHYSLLPRWRGAAPVVRAMLAGDESTGVCLMQMERGLDTGPVYARCEHSIAADVTAGELTAKLTDAGVQLLAQYLDDIVAGKCSPEPQSSDPAAICYAHKIKKNMGELNWQQPALQLARQVQAMQPWPVAYTHWQEESGGQAQLLRLWQVQALSEDELPAEAYPQNFISLAPGTLLAVASDYLDVMCGAQSVLRLQRLQRAGGKEQAARDFINAKRRWLQVGATKFGISTE